MNRKEIQEKLKEYKRTKKEDILSMIPVYQNDDLIAYLRPLTFDYKVSLPGIVSELSRWRSENSNAFASIFQVTDEKTEKWLKKFVLEKEDRIVFIVQDLANHYIGQIGLAGFDYEEKSAEIDAVVRGRKDMLPGVMSAALIALINWGRRELCIDKILLDVFDDNVHAIEFYKKNGFAELGRVALDEEKSESETRWKENDSIDPQLASRCYIRMGWRQS